MPAVRLFVDAPLAAGADILLTAAQAHYLVRVMRLGAGAPVALFNGRDGEWRAHVAPAGRGGCRLETAERLRPQPPESGPVLAFAPLRRARLEMLVEKATELGARALQPVSARRAQAGLGRPGRLRAHAVEAAEQCGRLDVPAIAAPVPLSVLLDRCDRGDRCVRGESGGALAWGDPSGAPPDEILAGAEILLVGPEGGFDDDERRALATCPAARAVTLGPRTLRAETAGIALLALRQALAAPAPDAACYDVPREP